MQVFILLKITQMMKKQLTIDGYFINVSARNLIHFKYTTTINMDIKYTLTEFIETGFGGAL